MRQSKDNHAEATNRESEKKTRAKQTASDDLEWEVKQTRHKTKQAGRQAKHDETERTVSPTEEQTKRSHMRKTHIHAIWLWQNEYSCGAKSLRIAHKLTASLPPSYTRFFDAWHNYLNTNILPKRKHRKAFSETWKRLFHRAEKPLWARRKAHIGRRERLSGYTTLLPEGSDQDNMAPTNRRDEDIRMNAKEEYINIEEYRRTESGQERKSARPHLFYFAKNFCHYFLLPVLHKYSVRRSAEAFCLRQYGIRMKHNHRFGTNNKANLETPTGTHPQTMPKHRKTKMAYRYKKRIPLLLRERDSLI